MTSEVETAGQEFGDLRRRVEMIEAILAIQNLKAKYGELVDSRFAFGKVVEEPNLEHLVNEIADLFTEEAEWDGGAVLGVARGRLEIAARLKESTLVFSRHFFVKPRIEVNLANAKARWDLLCPCKTRDGTSWWMCGHEDDEYVRERGVWRHSRMRLTTIFMSPADGAFDRILI